MGLTQVPGKQIKDGGLGDADIASDAAIAISKLALPSTLTEKTTPVDADLLTIGDSAASGIWKKITWANIKTAFGALFNIVEDTTPQLGGALDLNAKPVVEIFTAGESVVAGDVCYLKSDGKFWKADSDAESTCKGLLAMANASISANATGQFIVIGKFTTSGLTAGAVYYVSGTAGGITSTAPSTTGKIVRVVGYAESTTVFYFKPSEDYLEIL